jgi:hypothetical protein
MNKPAILGALLLGVAGYAAVSCSSKKDNPTTSTGGQSTSASGGASAGSGTAGGGASASGGAAATGGATATGGAATGGTLPFACGHADASVALNEEGGLARIGYTDPQRSVALGDGGHYLMPNTKYKGYCFTYVDTGGSAVYPPCGTTGPCFTASTGLCPSASLGAGSATTWGGGIGCNLNQAAGEGTAALYTDVVGMTSMTISVYGCAVPALLQVQLNVVNPPPVDDATPGSGYFCNRTTPLGDPDADGVRSATVQLTDLRQDCWLTGGPTFDPATMNVRSIQAQINAPEAGASNWDFCVSKWSIQ